MISWFFYRGIEVVSGGGGVCVSFLVVGGEGVKRLCLKIVYVVISVCYFVVRKEKKFLKFNF